MFDTRKQSHSSVIFAGSQGELVVDATGLPPGTFVQILGLALVFSAFLAGIFCLGV